jgi:hypothetical protein
MAASLEWRLTGGAANADPDASLGGTGSSVAVSGTALNNLFDDVTPGEAVAGDIEYRAIDLYNTGDAAAENVELWISQETTSADTVIAIALDAGTQSVVDEDTAPSAPTLSFGHPLSGSKQAVSDIAAGAAQRVWLRRTVSASATNNASDTLQLSVQFA